MYKVNGLHLYSAFIQSAVQLMPLIHPFTHTFTHQRRLSWYRPARQEQLGVRCLAQGHFDTPRVGSNRQPSDCQTTALTSWATSPQEPDSEPDSELDLLQVVCSNLQQIDRNADTQCAVRAKPERTCASGASLQGWESLLFSFFTVFLDTPYCLMWEHYLRAIAILAVWSVIARKMCGLSRVVLFFKTDSCLTFVIF